MSECDYDAVFHMAFQLRRGLLSLASAPGIGTTRYNAERSTPIYLQRVDGSREDAVLVFKLRTSELTHGFMTEEEGSPSHLIKLLEITALDFISRLCANPGSANDSDTLLAWRHEFYGCSFGATRRLLRQGRQNSRT